MIIKAKGFNDLLLQIIKFMWFQSNKVAMNMLDCGFLSNGWEED